MPSSGEQIWGKEGDGDTKGVFLIRGVWVSTAGEFTACGVIVFGAGEIIF